MTRKDFEEIARIVRAIDTDEATRRRVAVAFAGAFATTYTRFNYDKFMEACRP